MHTEVLPKGERMSKKGIKIKHRKYNLYHKKKSKGRQALTVVIMTAAVVALCVVGYGLGKPLMEYFNGDKTAQSDVSSDISGSEQSSQPQTDSGSSEVSDSSQEPSEPDIVEPVVYEKGVYSVSVSAMKNAQSLSAALSAAKAQGYEKVLLTLKTDSGEFMYKTENARLIYAADNIAGTLTAKELVSIAKAQGMTPYAAVSTLKDPLTGNYAVDIRYNTADGYGWLDAAANNGGKSWLSPFEQETSAFLADITAELAAAGFEKIVLRDVMYPEFKDADYNVYLSNLPQLTDRSARISALWSVISACSAAAKSGGASVMLQMDSHDLLASELLGTTAEAAGDKAMLSSVEVLVNYTVQSGAAYMAAKSVDGRLGSIYGTLNYSVYIADISNAEEIAKAFNEAGVTVFSE